MQQEIEKMESNLEITLEIAKSSYGEALDRLRNVESKFNMLLVYVGALLAGLTVILPFPDNFSCTEIALSNIFLGLYFVFIFSASISILIGLIPRKLVIMSNDAFVDMDRIQQEKKDLLGSFIQGYKDAIDSVEKHKKLKNIMFLLAFISLIVALVLFFAILMVIVF